MRSTFLPDRARSRAHVNERTSRCWYRLVAQAAPGPGDACHGTGGGAAPAGDSPGRTGRTADLGPMAEKLPEYEHRRRETEEGECVSGDCSRRLTADAGVRPGS